MTVSTVVRGAACACVVACTAAPAARTGANVRPTGPTYAYVNGQWFDGRGFAPRTMYSVNGVFAARAPSVIDSTLDLAGGYAIPPFGDAHTHNLDGPFNLDSTVARYVREGTFYVQVLTNVASRTATVRARFNQPCALDVAYANGGITSTLSHPFLAYEPRAITAIPPGADWSQYASLIRGSRIRLGDAYWFVDSLPDLERVWPQILAAHPDLVKIFLLDAQEHPAVMPDTGLPSGHGLRPSLVAPIVQRAHQAGLRVAAHIETANDARIAINAGVDMLAHLPGYLMHDGEDPGRYELDAGTVAKAGSRHVTVTPTLGWSRDPGGPTTESAIAARMQLQASNIMRLRRAGARIVVGSDKFGLTATGEFEEFRKLQLYSNAELLTIWGAETSRAIFPSRRLGTLAPGYEASFLVLAHDPLASLDALHDIRMRVKQGCQLR